MTAIETTTPSYQELVLQWQPDRQARDFYRLWLLICLVLAVSLALVLSLIEVPPKERVTREDIPERVARFMVDRPEVKPPEPIEQEQPKPLPVVEPKPLVERERPRSETREPATEEQRAAREKAERSGLLALGQQLDGLMDTSDVDAMVDTEASGGAQSGISAAGYGDGDLASVAGRRGASEVEAVSVESDGPMLARRELASVAMPDQTSGNGDEDGLERRKGFADTGRTDEEVSLVFDRNKGMLYSLYNRARRQTPGLQGRLVLEVTIAPSGEVTDVAIVSSELNSQNLEQRIKARVLQFRFATKSAETITIIYPIEFLPS